MSVSKAKGTLAESAAANYLKFQGWPHAERRALCGSVDRGDITGTPGVVWEVKAGTTLCIPEWLRETEAERVNAKADYGVLVVKPKGVGTGNVDRWWSLMPLYQMTALLRGAGYGGVA